jgi:hypothetical protein
MKLKHMGICSAALLALAAGSGAASAGTLTWNFYALTGSPAAPGRDLGSNIDTFTQNGSSLFVEAGTSSGCGPTSNWCPDFATDLYAKNAGPGEQGLGLTNDPYHDNEISDPYGIYLDLQGLGHATSVEMGSVQKGETWAIWGDNNPHGEGTWTELAWGVGTGAIVNYDSSLLANYDQLIVADPFLMNQEGGNSNNIVLQSITTAPEPGALALFGAGLLGCAMLLGRRRRARQS